MRFWKPGDIFETQCPQCDRKVEFFKDDVRRKCRCGHEIVNPKLDLGCAEWCPYAEQCVGIVPEEVKTRQRAEQKDLLRERICLEIKKYFRTDFEQVNHALAVSHYAERILKMEGGNPLVVLGAACLHDIGLHETSEKNDALGAEAQKAKRLVVAKGILEKLDVQREVITEICDLILELQGPKTHETLELQILLEAEWLAKIKEKDRSNRPEELERLIAETFKTKTGRKLAEELRVALSNH